MVDVGSKDVTVRTARASGRVRLRAETVSLVRRRELAKGDVLEVARLAGIMAAKRTADIVPLCHPLPLDSVEVDLRLLPADEPGGPAVVIRATVRTTARTGVEMEALAAVSAAALTVYDMAKSLDREMTIEAIRLEAKAGGSRGPYVRAGGSSAPD